MGSVPFIASRSVASVTGLSDNLRHVDRLFQLIDCSIVPTCCIAALSCHSCSQTYGAGAITREGCAAPATECSAGENYCSFEYTQSGSQFTITKRFVQLNRTCRLLQIIGTKLNAVRRVIKRCSQSGKIFEERLSYETILCFCNYI